MITAILLMAGMGSRMKASKNKMLLEVKNKPLFLYTIEKFQKHNIKIILVVSQNDLEYFESLNLGLPLVVGGDTRAKSVYNGLLEVKTSRVLIHDGARPLVSDEIIEACINSKSEAFLTAMKEKNTIRYDETNNYLVLDRSHLLSAQTPQGGDTHLFKESIKNAIENGIEITDDISALKNVNVEIIEGNSKNIKITTPEDLELFEYYLRKEKL